MKFETIKILPGILNSNSKKTASIIFMPPAPKIVFGQTMVRDSDGIAETYIFITKDLVVKATNRILQD